MSFISHGLTWLTTFSVAFLGSETTPVLRAVTARNLKRSFWLSSSSTACSCGRIWRQRYSKNRVLLMCG